jgi:hypothetical protein
MSLKDDVIDFLRHSREVLSLNFEAFGFRFSPSQYGLIADNIANGDIPVRDSAALPISKGAGASWKYALNEFWFTPGFDIGKDYWRAILAHEATHAVHDMLAPGAIDTAVAESIGYIAEALALYTQGNAAIHQKDGTTDPMRAEAMRAVTAMWDPTGLHSMVLSPADADALRAVVARHPHTVGQGPSVTFAGIH